MIGLEMLSWDVGMRSRAAAVGERGRAFAMRRSGCADE